MATPTTAITPSNYENIRNYAMNSKVIARFAEVVGSRQAAAYINSALLAVANNDALMKCTPQSVVMSALRAATLKLSCDPAIGQAHLVPFAGKAALVIGYRGLEVMAQRTGKYRYLHCGPVFEGQEVIENQMTGLHRIEGQRASRDAAVIGYMAYFQLLNGFEATLYMTCEEIDAHAQQYSKGYNKPDGPWKKEWHKMAKKTPFRLLLTRHGLLDPNDLTTMDAIENGDDQMVLDLTPAPKKERTEQSIMADLGFAPDDEAVEGTYSEPAATTQPAETTPAETGGQPVQTGSTEEPTKPMTEKEAADAYWKYVYEERQKPKAWGMSLLEQTGGAFAEALALAKKTN